METESDYQESYSITFEWTLKGLKHLFDSTKGEQKSKVTKSEKFGGGRWQILFYANAGTSKEGNPDSGFVSLYLSCEPTTEEKEVALADSGRWVRKGVYKFSFELRNLGKSTLYNLKEAHNHSFSYKTANWGWAQFARRDTVYYQSTGVKAQDAFVIICTISSSPAPPPPPPLFQQQAVPKSLLDTVGELLNDPLYSDVQFVIPRRNQDLKDARTIWAARRLLQRTEYFEAMFCSSFAEGSNDSMLFTPRITNRPLSISSDDESIMHEFEDSDNEDDDILADSPAVSETELPAPSTSLLTDTNQEENVEKNSHEASSNLSSPRLGNSDFIHLPVGNAKPPPHGKMTVVVRDVAYSTYYAILYYVYTNNIVFAPLSSSFLGTQTQQANLISSPPTTPSEAQGQGAITKRLVLQESAKTRAEWIKDWVQKHPGRPAPCSAKAVYRVADRLDLWELKERAAQHIFKSLTVDNIAYEVFSPFAAAFDVIRKVEIEFFLTNWQNIRASDSMRTVWQQIRNGRHPGFEEVWPLIAQSLEFKPTLKTTPTLTKGGDTNQQI